MSNRAWMLTAFGICALLGACTGPSGKSPPPPAPGVKLGKPYEINGEVYVPQVNETYDEIGIASWYGPGFHGKSTANGETFDQDGLTAAHTTLPMPCLVRVTNLENGKSAVVRINDRGPFKSKRIIDLSKGSAQALGITRNTRVRVQYLKEETEQYWASRNIQPSTDTKLARALQPGNADEVVGAAAPVMTVSQADIDLPKNTPEPAAPVQKDGETAAPAPLAIRPLEPKFAEVENAQNVASLDSANTDQPVEETAMVASAPELKQVLPEQKTTPDKESADAPGWYIQAGAFSVPENAYALAERLQPLGQTHVSEMQAQGKMLHRVRVGPVAERSVADDLRSKVNALGVSDAKVVRE